MLREVARHVLPARVEETFVATKNEVSGARAFLDDAVRFRKHYSRGPHSKESEQLQTRMIFHAHSLEKGLSHADLRLQFGNTAMERLAETMGAYCALGFDKTNLAYQNALSVLRAYVDLHEANGVDATNVRDLFSAWTDEIANAPQTLGGTTTVLARSKEKNRSKNFAELFADRTSVREYAARPVQPELISEAIGICSKSPSVCNRQPYRVRVITDTKQIEAILAVQGGMTGYPPPPVLLAVTTDIRDFVGMNERNQVYVDGGIYSMALMLALEFVGLAACPLNAMFSRSKEKQMRSLLGTQHEAFIMFIAVGHFASSSQAPKSFRYDEDKLVVED